MADGLPEGFTLDGPPEGFTVDKPEKPPIAWSDIPGQAYENLPESAGKFIHPFLHPIETVKGMAGLSGGLAEKAAPYAKGSPLIQSAAAASKYLGGNKNEQMADEFGQQMKDRYGGLENVKHTLAEDPVGAAADLSMVLTGGGSLASRLPGVAGRVGEVAGRVGSAIDPLRPVTKGIEKVGELLEPAKKIWNREQGVRLSAGQREADLTKIQREQAALRGQSGEPAQKHAQKFYDQQTKELGKLNDEIRESLDPHGNMVQDPVQAGSVVSQGMRDTYEMRRKVVSDHFYDAAKRLGGEINASWFDNIADRIKTDLSSGSRPIVIEDKLTPFANQALRDIEQQVETLRVPRNNAQPGGHPSRSQIVGVSLEGVDQIRRRLASWRDQAFKSGNAADGAATQAVLRSFESDMDVAVNSQHFSGDPRAPQAWNEARKAHSEVRETFGAGKRGDSAGQEVERMLGRRGSAPLTASDTFQSMVPVNLRSSTKHVETVNRVKKALGEDSPEFAAVRQGTFSRLTETPAGVKDWGPGKIADRINKFLNGDGRELAEAIFTPEQRARIAKYGELQRKLEIPQSGANWSNSATFVQRATGRILPWIGAAAGAGAAHMMGMPWMADIIGAGVGRYAGAKYAKRVADKASLKEVAPQLPISKRRVKGPLTRVSEAVRPGLSRVLQGEPTPRWMGRTRATPATPTTPRIPSQPTPEPIGRRVERAFSRFGPSKAKARGFGALGRYTQPYGDDNNPYASGGRVGPFFDEGGDVPSWYDSGTTNVGAPAEFPAANSVEWLQRRLPKVAGDWLGNAYAQGDRWSSEMSDPRKFAGEAISGAMSMLPARSAAPRSGPKVNVSDQVLEGRGNEPVKRFMLEQDGMKGRLHVTPEGVVRNSFLHPNLRGQGLGRSLYQTAADYYGDRGIPMKSDTVVSTDAARAYGSLGRQGYSVTRDPSATLIVDDWAGGHRGSNGDWVRKPVFTVRPRGRSMMMPGPADSE